MSKYIIIKHEVVDCVYEVEADNEEAAIDKVEVNSPDIKELAGQGFYECEYAVNKLE